MRPPRWAPQTAVAAGDAGDVRRAVVSYPACRTTRTRSLECLLQPRKPQPLSDLRAWLAYYGPRLNSAFALGEPSWIEDATPAIRMLQAYVTLPDRRPETEPAALAAEREQAVAAARARLAGYPQPIVTRFETLLKAAQVGAIVHEDHNFWIDQRLMYHIRRLILEFGRRLAQVGALATAGDVFYLTLDQLQSWRDAPMHGVIQKRKAEMERFGRVTPPPMLGTPPAFDMTDGGPMIRAMFKGELSPQNAGRPGASTITGMPGSAGVVRGRARVVHSLAEAGKLQPGDVLVTASTEPPWTPLFATAAAIVTDTGGVLSHSAVVAREYRIPAVVGTGHATSTFHDGQLCLFSSWSPRMFLRLSSVPIQSPAVAMRC